jgi:hypothetical protein
MKIGQRVPRHFVAIAGFGDKVDVQKSILRVQGEASALTACGAPLLLREMHVKSLDSGLGGSRKLSDSFQHD